MRILLISFIIIPLLISCSSEPSAKDIELISNNQISKITSILHSDNFSGVTLSKITGIQDIKIESVEKIQCLAENTNSKIYLCDVLIKYEVKVSQNSISDLVGFSGKKSELKKLKLFKSNNGWEIL
jgi:hypothetical protein